MPAPKTRTIGPGNIRASVVPSSVNEGKRTVDLVWSTGARVLRGSWDPYYEELSMKPKHVRMERLKSGNAPLLNSHRSDDIDDVIGVVEKASLKKGEGHATVRFDEGDAGEEAFRKVVSGIISNVSVGYRTFKIQMTEESIDEVPVYRAVDWEPHELSMVPIGADAGASVRNPAPLNACTLIEADAHQEQREIMKDKPVTTPTPDAAPAAAPAVEARAAAPAQASVSPEQAAEIKAGERKRISAIRRCAATLDVDAKTAEKAIADGVGADAFRKAALDDFEERSKIKIPDEGSHPSVTAGDDAKDKFSRGISAMLIGRSSMAGKVRKAAERRGEKIDLDPGEFRGMTLLDVCRASLEQNGQSARGMSKMELAGKALSFRSEGGFSSTSDFPNLLENVLHKMLLAAWRITPDTWSRFCRVGSVSDFRDHNRYRQGTFGVLDAVNEHGEFENKPIPDARKETIAAITKGNIIALTRQAIVNDDMDAFARLASQLGRAARLSIESDVYAALAENGGLGPLMSSDGLPLFDAAHGNIGAGAALSTTSVEADRVVMKTQTDESGNEILDLSPAILLVPAGLGGTARQVNDAQYDLADVGGFAPNVVNGLYRDIVDTGRMAGTRRYSFADPADAPVLEVAFLDGVQEPYLEMQEGFRVDGTKWKVRIDYGVGAIGFRGAVTNAGA